MVKPIDSPMKSIAGKLAFVLLNEKGADRLRARLEGTPWRGPLHEADIIVPPSMGKKISQMGEELFREYAGLVFVMSSGIALRVIAPVLKSKYDDPAVVILDDQWRFGVSALSGHEGGANWLACQVAKLTDAVPVISTGRETNKAYTLGIGCRRGTGEEEILGAVKAFLAEQGRDVMDIRWAASVDIKKGEEGMTRAFDRLGLPLLYFSGKEINEFDGAYTPSEASVRQLGIKGVAEPCALLAGRNSVLVKTKTINGPVTLALAKEEVEPVWEG